MTETSSSLLSEACAVLPARDRRNQRRFLWILFLWAVVFVGASQLLRRELVPEGAVSWLVAALPAVAWIAVMLAFARFLHQADELQRQIQLHALALGFGAGWLAVSGYRLFERAGAPAMEVGDYTLVMAAFYTVGLFVGTWRYR